MFNYNPKISIIIPAYNASNFLTEAIDCALNQTYKNIEVIVVNDGSKDNGKTEKIAKSYGDKIRYFYKENGGSSSALNYGIKNMTGEWFSWLSHDDLYTKDKLYKQVELLNELYNSTSNIEDNVIIAEAEFINSNGKVIKKPRRKKIRNTEKFVKEHFEENEYFFVNFAKYNFHGCAFLIHKKIFDKVGVFDEKLRLLNDVEMFFRIYTANTKIHYIPKVLVQGRVHAAQVSKSIGYGYHNPEQDAFWNKCFDYIKTNKPNDLDLFYQYGAIAYLKTRYVDGDKAFEYIILKNPKKKFSLKIKKAYLILRSKIWQLGKKIYLKVFAK